MLVHFFEGFHSNRNKQTKNLIWQEVRPIIFCTCSNALISSKLLEKTYHCSESRQKVQKEWKIRCLGSLWNWYGGSICTFCTMYSAQKRFFRIFKNCQNGTFLPVHENQKFFGPNAFIWSAKKVPFSDFIQNMSPAPSMCLFMWIKVDK